jgi:hypothetical protein
MATTPTGLAVNSPIVHATRGTNDAAGHQYRNECGMFTNREWTVHIDDFVQVVTSNVPTGWTAAIIDTGSTVTTYATALAGANGVIQIFDATVSEGAAIYLPKGIQLNVGKKFFMEARIYTDDITDNDFQMGLSDLTATTNPEDLWTTTSANLIAFGILDGSAVTGMLSDKSNSGTVLQAGSQSIVASTWTTLAISYDGISTVKGWVNGKESLTWSGAFATTVPVATVMAPFVGARNGNGAGSNVNLVDFVRVVLER